MRDFGLSELPHEVIDNRRWYKTPQGVYPSVTTVLGLENQDAIERWRQRVGEEKADFIKERALRRGTEIHSLLERHLRGEKVYPSETTNFFFSLFSPIRDYLDRNLKETWCIEAPLYSDLLKVAGRTDCVGVFDEPEIIDFKGSSKEKKKEHITSYFMQVAAYAYMFKERTGIRIDKYRILIVDEFGKLQVFQGHTRDHIRDFAMLRKKFQTLYQTKELP